MSWFLRSHVWFQRNVKCQGLPATVYSPSCRFKIFFFWILALMPLFQPGPGVSNSSHFGADKNFKPIFFWQKINAMNSTIFFSPSPKRKPNPVRPSHVLSCSTHCTGTATESGMKLVLASNRPYIKPWQHRRCASTNDPDSEEDNEEGGCEHHLASVGCRVSDGQCKCHCSPEACGDQRGKSPDYKDKWKRALKCTAPTQS